MRGSDYEVGGKTLWEMAASHLMERDLFAFNKKSSCHDIVTTMVKENFGSAPIINGEGRLVGMVTEYDLLDLLLDGKDLKEVQASECMTPAISISEEMTAEQIVTLLQARHLIRVPVTDRNGILIGLVARRDILAGYLESALAPLPIF